LYIAYSNLGEFTKENSFTSQIINRYHFNPSKTIFIDDSLRNVKRAETVGIEYFKRNLFDSFGLSNSIIIFFSRGKIDEKDIFYMVFVYLLCISKYFN
jgi:hypothetical protein